MGNGKVLAVFPLEIHRSSTRGLIQKSKELVRTARRLNIIVDAIFICSSSIFIWKSESSFPDYSEHLEERNHIFAKWYRTVGMWRDLIRMIDNFAGYSAVWSRITAGGLSRYRFFEKMKFLQVQIVLDIPTYPIVNEHGSFFSRNIHSLFSLSNDYLFSLADRIATTSTHPHIQGVQTLRVKNGISLETGNAAVIRNYNIHPEQKQIRAFGAGQWNAAHGLDRFLKGVAEFRNQYTIQIELAGTGPEVPKLKALAKTLGLDITWLGDVYGASFWLKLSQADIGIGSLGDHRSNVKDSSSMKHLNYAIAGLPFVCDINDTRWAAHPFVYQSPADESPVDLRKVVSLVKESQGDGSNCWNTLRDSAFQYSWESTYEEVFEYLFKLK